MRRFVAAVLPALIVACADSEPATGPGSDPTPEPEMTSPILPAAPPKENVMLSEEEISEARSDQSTQGQWTTKQIAGNPAALFGRPETEAKFTVRCEQGSLVLSRGIAMREGSASMTLTAGGKLRRLDATAKIDPLPAVTASIPADDPFAATLAEADDAIAVRIEKGPSLRMPQSDALREVVSGCRR